MPIHRRAFLRSAAAVALGFGGLRAYTVMGTKPHSERMGFGPLEVDPKGLLDLPKGFTYQVVSTWGEKMADGFLVPGLPDGMATFPGPDGKTILIRNHELDYDQGSLGTFGQDFSLVNRIDPSLLYDAADGLRPHVGGTTTVLYDTKERKVEAQWLSLAGTSRNCAGGPTPWGTWITCEETTDTPAINPGFLKDHGYAFEVPATAAPSLARPVPLVEMGRFRREAIAVDPNSSVIYQTEDMDDGLLYRFIPKTPGKAVDGGKLQALKVRNRASLDTRNWEEIAVAVGDSLVVDWVDLENVQAPDDDLRHRGFEVGAARFARGEGMWYGLETVYFACTSGGPTERGQIWKYRPSPYEGSEREKESPGTLELFIESNESSILQRADNLTVSPWGDLVVCEDGDIPDQLVGITPSGESYPLARNASGDSECAGCVFSPDGTCLFVNIQVKGLTLAIFGPFKDSMARPVEG